MVNCEDLANAIVILAVEDYKKAVKSLKANKCETLDQLSQMHRDKKIEKECTEFFNSGWFSILTNANIEVLIKDVKEIK